MAGPASASRWLLMHQIRVKLISDSRGVFLNRCEVDTIHFAGLSAKSKLKIPIQQKFLKIYQMIRTRTFCNKFIFLHFHFFSIFCCLDSLDRIDWLCLRFLSKPGSVFSRINKIQSQKRDVQMVCKMGLQLRTRF